MKGLLLLTMLALGAAACDATSLLQSRAEGLYPGACQVWNFPDRQCEAIVDSALAASGLAEDDVAEIWLLPFEREVTLGGGQVALVGLELADGTVVEQPVHCTGIAVGRACNPDAEIWVSGGVDRDVPCAGEAPDGCATLPPTPHPDAVAAAQPLHVAELDIPIDRAGHYEVEVGRATLPNGSLTERSMSVVDARPDDYWIDQGIGLEVRPDDPARPPVGSIYREPFPGPEPVTVFVVFDVTDLDEPAILELRDLIVR